MVDIVISYGRITEHMGNSLVTIQNSFNAGELSPSLYGRIDLEKWHSGASTARNFFVNYRGGMASRAGLAYVGTCKQPGTSYPPRDIPFQFSLNQGYVLEFGDQYLRIKSNGAYIVEATKTVSSVSSSGLFTTSSVHGYSVGDWVFDTGNTGFSGLTWIVASTPTTTTFTVTNLFGTSITSATPSGAGTVARIYTVVAPYAAVDLPYLKYTQSADVMTLTCVNTATQTEYVPYDLARLGNTNWTFTAETFGATITAPTNLVAKAQSSGVATTWYSYVVTAVSSTNGEESVASLPVSIQNNDIAITAGSNTITWPDVAGASSYNVYAATPSYAATVQASSLYGFIGTALGPSFTDTNITPDFTQVPPIHNNPFSRGAVTDVVRTAGGTNYNQSTIGYTITTSTGTGFSGLPVASNGAFVGFIIYNKGSGYQVGDTIAITDSGGGLATGTLTYGANPADGDIITFNGIQFKYRIHVTSNTELQIEATLALTIQSTANFLNSDTRLSLSVATYTSGATTLVITYKTPGAVGNAYTYNATNLTGGGTAGSGATATLTIGPETGTYPGVCAYFQQRRVYGASLNQPDTYWMSQPGLFHNMDSSIPVVASDSITGTPWAQQVNGIQFLVPMPGGLVVLTGKGAWQVNGGSQVAITPSNQNATPQAYNGCNATVPPITNNYDILYLQSKGSIFRDLSYNFFVNIYTGTDLTVLSSQLFTDYQMIQWAWSEEPYKLIWVVRADGVLLCLTYLKEQEIQAWTRHDTDGLFVGVCSVTEPPVDAVYVIVKRYVQGAWRYYSERFNDRVWNNVEDAFCVDSGLSTTLTYPSATLSPSASSGSGVNFVASSGVFTSGNIGDIIRVGGGVATVTGYTSTTTVVGTLTQPITSVIPNDPTKMPVPQIAGNWSIASPVTSISGLNHLEGLTVAILADGSVSTSQVVTNGTVTLPYAASYIHIGLPYTCQLQTLYIDGPTKDGTVQDRRKTISALGIRVEASRAVQIGADQPDQAAQQNYSSPSWSNMTEIKTRTNSVYAGIADPLYTGDWYQSITAGWTFKGQAAIQQTYPLPCNILSVIQYWESGDDKGG